MKEMTCVIDAYAMIQTVPPRYQKKMQMQECGAAGLGYSSFASLLSLVKHEFETAFENRFR